MLIYTTSVPELDLENARLFQAAEILQKLGNSPELTAEDFDYELALAECDPEEIRSVTLAAIAIETMTAYTPPPDDLDSLTGPSEPTIH